MEEVLNYEGLVYSIIGRYPKRFDRDDLYQVGMIGLIDAYRHYDVSFDTKFSSFAYYYIVGEVNKYISSSSSLKVSRELVKLKRSFLSAKEKMTQKLGREPTNEEVALFLDVDVELVEEAICATDEVASIEDDYNALKTYDDTSAEIMDLKEEINKLPENERKIILARYFDDLTQRETSNLLGMSQVQVSRSEAKILQKLRTQL